MRDPIEDNPADLDRQHDEEVREARWLAFVEIVLSYAESDGWPTVLAAVAWAMKEPEQRP